MNKKLKILNYVFTLIDRGRLFDIIENCIKKRNFRNIVASDFRHVEYFSKCECLKSSTLAYPDSSGIFFIIKIFFWKGSKGFYRIVSTDFHFKLLGFAANKGFKIFLLGDTQETLTNFENKVSKNFPNLEIVGKINGFDGIMNPNLIAELNNANADILLIGLGVPKQEKWLMKHSEVLNIPVRITVGAFFNFYGGKYKRAPKLMSALYMEWLYRFLREPRRLFPRYFITYPKVILSILHEKWFGKR